MNPLILFIIVAIAFAAGVAWGRRSRGDMFTGVPTGDELAQRQRFATGFSFAEEVRSTLTRAREEAGLLGHPRVGPEHILLGLLHVDSGVTRGALERLRIEPAALRSAILNSVKPGTPHTVRDLPYTSPAKRVLENAMNAALDLGHIQVGTVHVLLGLSRDSGSVGKLLADAGADPETLRREIHGTPT